MTKEFDYEDSLRRHYYNPLKQACDKMCFDHDMKLLNYTRLCLKIEMFFNETIRQIESISQLESVYNLSTISPNVALHNYDKGLSYIVEPHSPYSYEREPTEHLTILEQLGWTIKRIDAFESHNRVAYWMTPPHTRNQITHAAEGKRAINFHDSNAANEFNIWQPKHLYVPVHKPSTP